MDRLNAIDFTVLWDNDGVLVDTEGFYFASSRDVLRSVGVELTLEQFQEISLRRGQSTLNLAAAQGLDEGRIAELRAARDLRFAELLAERSPAIDGAEAALASLAGRVGMGIVTSSQRKHFDIAHAQTGLLRYVDFILTREDYGRAKPDPDPYRTAVERFGLRPERCVAIEDSERGLASAVAAGLRCVVVRSSWTNDGDFRAALAVVPDVSRVPEIVLSLAQAATL
jgi:HAD superfamily hydrolase (TIGR01509 family)